MDSKEVGNGLQGIMSIFKIQSKNSELMPSSNQQVADVSKKIQDCMFGIKKQKDMARDAVHLKGWFKGKKRDEALADAIIATADTQEKTIILVQESIKFFGYAFSHLEGQLFEDREASHKKQLEMADFVESFADDLDDNTKKYLEEIGSGLNSYNQKIVAKIKEQDGDILALSDTVAEIVKTSKELEDSVSINLEEMSNRLDSLIKDKSELESKIIKLVQQGELLTKRVRQLNKVTLTLMFISLSSIGITVFALLKLLHLG